MVFRSSIQSPFICIYGLYGTIQMLLLLLFFFSFFFFLIIILLLLLLLLLLLTPILCDAISLYLVEGFQ